jgi:hypothetical protein
VLLDSKAVKLKANAFPRMTAGQQIETQEGRAEILLGPGSVLRLGENASAKMLSDRIEDTRLEVLGGSAVVECTAQLKDNAVTLIYKDATISLLKNGLYRLDSEPAQLSVFDGEARVEQGGQVQVVKRARRLPLNGVSTAEKFDNRTGDVLFRWARQRSEFLATANRHAALSATRGTGSGWLWSNMYGMYTFVPGSGICRSFWGYNYWSPYAIYQAYTAPAYTSSGPSYPDSSAYTSTAGTSAGTSGTAVAAAPATASSSAASAPISHSSGSASGGRR